jgi:hypothetical protein
VVAATGALVALSGCGGSAKQAATTGPQLPPGCTVDEADTIVTSFLARPDLAPPSFFKIYAARDTDGRSFVTHRRGEALAHLRRRLALGERDRLISLRVFTQDINQVGITFRLTRYAPDFRARRIYTRVAQGAGTIDCAHGKIAAWSMKGP